MLSLGINDKVKNLSLTRIEYIDWQRLTPRDQIIVGHDTGLGEILELMESEADFEEAVRNFGLSSLKLYHKSTSV